MSKEQTAYVGDDIKILVNVTDSDGAAVAAVINTTTTRLHGLSTAPTVTTIATGIYQIVFSGVSPAPVEADTFTCKVNGTIGGVGWSEYGISVKIIGKSSDVLAAGDIDGFKLEEAMKTTDDFGRDARSIMRTLENIKDPEQVEKAIKEDVDKIKVLNK